MMAAPGCRDVESAELLDHAVHRFGAEGLIAHVARQEKSGAAGIPHESCGLLGICDLLGQMHDRDVRALARISDRDGAPDARVCAGDQGAPADESA